MSQTLSDLRKKPHHSFSSINGFVNICSLQYAFRYIYKAEAESTPVSLLFGSAFHRTCEWIAEGRMQNESYKIEEAQDVFSECWTAQCLNADKLSLTKDEWEQLNATGRKMIACLDREWTEKTILNVAKAFTVRLESSDVPLIGEIDLIIKDKHGEIVLVDWKTAARKWPAGKCAKDLQATCFCYAMKQLTGLDHGFRYDVITKAKEPSYSQHCTTRTDDDYARLSRLVRVVETAVQNEVFLPNEQSFYCGGCQYSQKCKSWHRKQARTISIPAQKAA